MWDIIAQLIKACVNDQLIIGGDRLGGHVDSKMFFHMYEMRLLISTIRSLLSRLISRFHEALAS